MVKLTESQQLIYDAYKVDESTFDGTLKEQMTKYWNEVNETGDRGGNHMYMFNSKPPTSFDTFPLLKQKTEPDVETVKNVNYLHDLIKILHYRDPIVGRKLIDGIRDNDLCTYVSAQDGEPSMTEKLQLVDLREEMKSAQRDIAAEAKKLKNLKRANAKRKRSTLPLPVVASSINIRTDQEAFVEANYDVSKLITSVASFSVNSEDCEEYPGTTKVSEDPGTRLQQYHDTLYSRAQQTLNRLSSKQEAINKYRMRQIKREWDHYAMMFAYDFMRLPPGYNPLPATNSWIRQDNMKFVKLDCEYAKQLMNEPWGMDDYMYFDHTLKNDQAGYEAWVQWASKEKKQYSIYCMEEFVKPYDWEAASGRNANRLKIGPPVRFNQLKPFKIKNDPNKDLYDNKNNKEYLQQAISGLQDKMVTTAVETRLEIANDFLKPILRREEEARRAAEAARQERERKERIKRNMAAAKKAAKVASAASKFKEGGERRKEERIKKNIAAVKKAATKGRLLKKAAEELKEGGERLRRQKEEEERERLRKEEEERLARLAAMPPVKLDKKSDAMYQYDFDGKEYYLRIVNEPGSAHDELTTELHGKKYTHLIPIVKYNQNGDFGTYTQVSNGIMLDSGEKLPIGQVDLTKVHAFYIQPSIGISLAQWVDEKYYNGTLPRGTDGRKIITNLNTSAFNATATEYPEIQKQAFNIAKSAKKAVDQFHNELKNRFIHRDIKLENMTVDENGIVRLFDFDAVIDTKPDKIDASIEASVIPMTQVPEEGGKRLMDRYRTKDEVEDLIRNNGGLFLDYHQLGLLALQLGGVFDWVGEYDASAVIDGRPRLDNERTLTFVNTTKYGRTRPLLSDKIKVINFWANVCKNKGKQVERTDLLIESVRTMVKENTTQGVGDGQDSGYYFNQNYNISKEFGEWIWGKDQTIGLFRKSDELKAELNSSGVAIDLGNGIQSPTLSIQSPISTGVQSPMQFLSNSRQPVFERVQIESDYGEEDLEALMEFDPSFDGEKLETSSHISDEEFERMLNEATDYNALSEHIMRENKAYSDHSTEVEEDAKSISSKASNTSELSVASQMSNMSAHSVASNMSSNSVASNMSSNSVASNISAASNMSANSVASNLSAASEKSNMSEMSNHSYASHHSMESEEAYPTSEHSNTSYGQYSEQSYNNSSALSNHSSSGESSGKELGYSAESSDHGMSESSDHESSNESMGYSSSGISSSHNHSYNDSNSETE